MAVARASTARARLAEHIPLLLRMIPGCGVFGAFGCAAVVGVVTWVLLSL